MNNSWRFFNPQSRKITKQLTFTVYTVAIIVVSLYPTSPDETLFAWDKLGHFLAYMVMLLIGFMAFPSKKRPFYHPPLYPDAGPHFRMGTRICARSRYLMA